MHFRNSQFFLIIEGILICMNKNEFNPNHPFIVPIPTPPKGSIPPKPVGEIEDIMKVFKHS